MVLHENSIEYKLVTLDVTNNTLSAKKITIGNDARGALDAVTVSAIQKFEFQSACLKMLTAVNNKLQQCCPLKYSMLCSAKALDPKVMAAAADSSLRYFQGITKRLVSRKWKTPALCDQAERQDSQFKRS